MKFSILDFCSAFEIQTQWGVDYFLQENPVNRFESTIIKNDKKSISSNIVKVTDSEKSNIDIDAPINKSVPSILNNISPNINSSKPRSIAASISVQEAINTAYDQALMCNTLAELRNAIENFDQCFLKNTAHTTVFSDGDESSDILLLGEAPGREEDKFGKPFVGRSGRLLDKMFESVGLSREKNLYITNVIPWRPPGNRTPNQQEIAICMPFLLRHLQIISPKIIVLVGATALNALNGIGGTISQFRNRWYSFNPANIMASKGEKTDSLLKIHNDLFINKKNTADEVKNIIQPLINKGNMATFITYHPSYLLRSPSNKKKVWFDLLELKTVSKALNFYNVN